jgi:hypothetical protein
MTWDKYELSQNPAYQTPDNCSPYRTYTLRSKSSKNGTTGIVHLTASDFIIPGRLPKPSQITAWDLIGLSQVSNYSV